MAATQALQRLRRALMRTSLLSELPPGAIEIDSARFGRPSGRA
jgi:hypothetical protein